MAWGEPLLWGESNYSEILPFITREFDGLDYSIAIQTNLSLISDELIDLFKEYKVSVGCSLDGPEDIHNSQRVTADGKGTHKTIMDKIDLCRKRGLHVGCIVVGSKKHIGKIPQLYQFMCNNNIGFKFNPIFSAGEAKNNIDEFGLTPDEYATMAIELFDLWFYDSKHKVGNSIFTDIASSLISQKNCSHCLFNQNCQDNIIAVSPNGDIVPCGRFCDDGLLQYAYGNLYTESLDSILHKVKQSEIFQRPQFIKDSGCGECEFYKICYGGCMFDGFTKTGDLMSKTFLCSAYKRVFTHILKRLRSEKLLTIS